MTVKPTKTSAEVIKGLECCQPAYDKRCKECPYSDLKKKYISSETCDSTLRSDVLVLISAQSAEKETLKAQIECLWAKIKNLESTLDTFRKWW